MNESPFSLGDRVKFVNCVFQDYAGEIVAVDAASQSLTVQIILWKNPVPMHLDFETAKNCLRPCTQD